MNRPKIFITRKVPSYLIEPYEDRFQFRMWKEERTPIPINMLYEEALEADGLLCLLTERIDEPFLEHAKHLSIIANMAVGYDNIDVASAEKYDIVVTNTPDVLTETTADLTFALLMATARRLVESSNLIYQNEWKEWSPFELVGTDVFGKTIGIVGMGRIGTAVAQRAKGFNMNILYHNRSRNERAEEELQAKYVSFDELLESSDFVVSLLPLSEETEKKFNKEAFEKMKETAYFINVSRGGVVDEEALYTALKERKIKAAGLDVFTNEPIDTTHPFTTLDNVLLTPHIGSSTKETREKMFTLCLENLDHYFHGDGALTPITKNKK